MKQPNFFSNSNLRRLGIPAAAVTVTTLIFGRGNFIAAIVAGIGTAISVYLTNDRLVKKAIFLQEKTQNLEETIKELIKILDEIGIHVNSSKLESFKKYSAFSKENSMLLHDDLKSLKEKLDEY